MEVVEHGPGTGWVVDTVAALRAKHDVSVVVCDKGGPAAALLDRMLTKGIDVVTTSTGEHAQACGGFYDDVMEGRLKVRTQPVLEAAVLGAGTRPVADAWLWSRTRSSVDITPLVAVTLARWGHLRVEEVDGPSVYEDRGLVVL